MHESAHGWTIAAIALAGLGVLVPLAAGRADAAVIHVTTTIRK